MQSAALLLVLLQLASGARDITGIVVDASGAPVAGARVRAITPGRDGTESTTGADGAFSLSVPIGAVSVTISADGFADEIIRVDRDVREQARIVLRPRGIAESIDVSAASDQLRVPTPAGATVLDRASLESAPSWTVDDQLRSVPGFTLFRRSSSRVANPTTQGVTLRGLAASGASRTAVLADGIPLNDPFGGWVYWDRVPIASIDRIEVARGGSSDLHGSDALGGAIRISTATGAGSRMWIDGGSHTSVRSSTFAGLPLASVDLFAAAESATSDGYVIVAPEARGPIDVPASLFYGSGTGGVSGPLGGAARFEGRGGYFTEERGNGTPFQTNATIVRQGSASASGAGMGGNWSVRAYGASQDYDQTFSAVAADRRSERPLSFQHVDASSLGTTAEWLRGSARYGVLLSGMYRRVNADLFETPATPGAATTLTPARQQTGAGTIQLTLQPADRVTVGGGVRAEVWTSELRTTGADNTLWRVLPRASIAAQVSETVSLRAAVHKAYRTPTVNELYRPFRVGNVLTQANASLGPEESFGVEGALLFRRSRTAARLIGFWTRLDDAVVNVTLASTPSLIVRERRNAGRIRSAGVELEADLRLAPHVTFTTALAFIDSVFVEGAGLDGLRVPQVPQWQASTGIQATWSRVTLTCDWRFIGEQYDDDRNQFLLDESSMINARAGWRVRRSLEIFGAIENAFDEEQDVGRTPLRTIGLPRTVRFGIRWTL
jgi:outer membrane receptor protein involved in Fe transport